MPEKSKELTIESEYSPQFRRILLSGIWGIITQVGLEATIFSEQVIVDDVAKSPKLDKGTLRMKRTVEAGIIINPLQMKAIYTWLESKIKEYEHIFGKIPSDEDIKKRVGTLSTINKKTPKTS